MAGTQSPVSAGDRRLLMKVSVYKGLDGALSVLVQASVGKGLAPVMVGGITLKNFQGKVLPVIDAMRSAKKPNQHRLPLT